MTHLQLEELFQGRPLFAHTFAPSHYDQQTVKAADYRQASGAKQEEREGSFVIELTLTRAWCQEVNKVHIEHGWKLVHILSALPRPWAVKELWYSFVSTFKNWLKRNICFSSYIGAKSNGFRTDDHNITYWTVLSLLPAVHSADNREEQQWKIFA